MKAFFSLLLLLLIGGSAHANNIVITDVTLRDQNKTASPQHTTVQFNLSWDNSWSTGTSWDAAWVFIKYKVGDGEWHHGELDTSASAHAVTNSGGRTIKLAPSKDGKGIFIHRTDTGNGTNTLLGVKLKWNYGKDGISDTASVRVKVFGVEMVYVPQGAFYAGDKSSTYSFQDNNDTSQPALVNTEGSFTIFDGYSGSTSISASFPKATTAIT